MDKTWARPMGQPMGYPMGYLMGYPMGYPVGHPQIFFCFSIKIKNHKHTKKYIKNYFLINLSIIDILKKLVAVVD